MNKPNIPSCEAPGAFLYKVDASERAIFGDAWCGPAQFEYGTQTLVARYQRDQEEGYDVEVLCTAMPARTFTIVAGHRRLRRLHLVDRQRHGRTGCQHGPGHLERRADHHLVGSPEMSA